MVMFLQEVKNRVDEEYGGELTGGRVRGEGCVI